MAESLFNIPDLVYLLAKLLDSSDLVNCLQVSSKWHNAIAPIIWNSFDDRTGMWNNEILRKSSQGRDQAWVDSVFQCYGHLIRHASLSWLGTMQAARDHCHSLISLELYPGTRVTEQQAEVIHAQVTEHNRLALEQRQMRDARKAEALAAHIEAGQTERTFRWNHYTGQVIEDPTATSQSTTVSTPKYSDFSPILINHVHIPTSIWGPMDGTVDPEEITTMVQILQGNSTLRRLMFAQTERIPPELVASFEDALSKLVHLKTAIMALNAGQLARLPNLLPGIEELDLESMPKSYQRPFFEHYSCLYRIPDCSLPPPPPPPPTANKLAVDRISKMTRNHFHLRSLTLGHQLTHIGQMGALLDHCPRLEKLSVNAHAFSGSNLDQEDPELDPLSGLANLRSSLPTQHSENQPVFSTLFKVHRGLKDLTILRSNDADWLGCLLDRFPCLESLTLDGNQSHHKLRIAHYFVVRPSSIEQEQRSPHQHLKSLTLSTNIDGSHLIDDIMYCPKLETLILDNCHYSDQYQPQQHQQQYTLGLKALDKLCHFLVDHQDGPHFVFEEHDLIVCLLRQMPNLETFQYGYAGPEVIEILTTVCNQSLKIVNFDEDGLWYLKRGPSTDFASRILSSCPNLEEFIGVQYEVNVNQLTPFPWVCRNLKKLRTQIIGVPRMTRDEELRVMSRLTGGQEGISLPEPNAEEQNILDRYEYCQKVHHRVFDRLAQMTELTHLDLGYENRNPRQYKYEEYVYDYDGNQFTAYSGPFEDTLELTLKAGLGRLGNLRKLELFGFEAVDHRMELQEAQWMAEAWPNLKLMYGLGEECFYDAMIDQHRDTLREWLQVARPDIVHSTLFVDCG